MEHGAPCTTMISTTPMAYEAAGHDQSPPCKMPSWPCDIDSTRCTEDDRSRAAGQRPPSPCQMPSWPCDIDGTFSPNDQTQQFIALAHLALDRQEYLDSLVPPSSEELIRIAGLQAIKEAQHKRRDRIHRRAASEASLQRYRHQAFLPIHASGASEQHDSRGSSRPPSSCRSASSSPHRPGPEPIITRHNRSKSAAALQQKPHHGGCLHSQQKPIDASTRWTQAIREARFRLLTAPRSRTGLKPEILQALPLAFVVDLEKENADSGLLALLNPKPPTARQRWQKAIAVACRAGFDPYAATASDSLDEMASSSYSDEIEEFDYSSEMEYISSSASSSLRSNKSDDSAYHSDHDSEHCCHHPKTATPEAKRKLHVNVFKEEAKIINHLYLLELVDLKHRYGINLFLYHQEWKRSAIQENFFFWLDFGKGKFLDLAAEGCSREKLEREQIRYLSFEEQELYRVVVGSGGRLCWAKNGLPVDTDAGRWRDSVLGIVALDDDAPVWEPTHGRGEYQHGMEAYGDRDRGNSSWFASACSSGQNSRAGSSWFGDSTVATSLSSSSLSSSSREGAVVSTNDDGLAEDPSSKTKTKTKSPPSRMNKLKYGNSPASRLVDRFLRQQWGAKPWIFVADPAGRLYVGIKDSGSFQHTSFVRGSRVSAAGMISVKEGRVTGLSPLSGHYRPPTRNFRALVRSLRERGVYFGGDDNSHLHSCGCSSSSTVVGDGACVKDRGRLKRLGWEEMKLCYGHDYWLLRGFEIYSGVRRSVFGCCDDHNEEEVSPKGRRRVRMPLVSWRESKRGLLSMKSMASLLTMDKADGTVNEERRTKI